jgi:hypothetical protein
MNSRAKNKFLPTQNQIDYENGVPIKLAARSAQANCLLQQNMVPCVLEMSGCRAA